VIEDLMQEVDDSTWEWLRDADKVLQELAREERAVHDVACVMDLADETSEVLNGTRWSRQCCMEFHKELEWELQANDKVVSKLELSKMSTDMRQAAHLRTREVNTAAYQGVPRC
jgi:hypothetical protein